MARCKSFMPNRAWRVINLLLKILSGYTGIGVSLVRPKPLGNGNYGNDEYGDWQYVQEIGRIGESAKLTKHSIKKGLYHGDSKRGED